jgi:hypothetical protein
MKKFMFSYAISYTSTVRSTYLLETLPRRSYRGWQQKAMNVLKHQKLDLDVARAKMASIHLGIGSP